MCHTQNYGSKLVARITIITHDEKQQCRIVRSQEGWVCQFMGLPSLRFNLLGALLIVVSVAVLINAGSADQTVTVTTTVGLTPCVSTQTTAACGGPPASYVQVLELLLLLVLILAGSCDLLDQVVSTNQILTGR